MIGKVIQVMCIIAMFSSPCLAQDWAKQMFSVVKHDFGTIARGAKAEYEFVFTNSYVDDIQVASARASCGCTKVTVKKATAKTYDKGAIVARINSDSFLGHQSATITVTFDKPSRVQVQLHVKVYVQSDIVLKPASVFFDSIEQGQAAERTVRVIRNGRADWKILDVKSTNPHLTAQVVDSRQKSGKTEIEVKVSLDRLAPEGRISEHLMLVTNDQTSRQIALPVDGQVVPELSASPNTLFLGSISPGETASRNVVIRAKKPFRITSIKPECSCLTVDVPKADQPKKFYVIPITFTASGETRKVNKKIRIETDMGGSVVEFAACAAVIKPEAEIP